MPATSTDRRVLCIGLIGVERITAPGVDTTGWGGAALYFGASHLAGGGDLILLSSLSVPEQSTLEQDLSTLDSRLDLVAFPAEQPTTFNLSYDDHYEIEDFSYSAGSIGQSGEAVNQFAQRTQQLLESGDFRHVHLCPMPSQALPAVAKSITEAGVPYSLQVHFSEAQSSRELLQGLMTDSTATFMNRSEAMTILSLESEEDLYAAIPALVSGTAFVTDRAGVSVYSGATWSRFIAPTVPVVDPTGAGDSFAGCAVAQLLLGRPIRDVVNLGLCMAALAIGAPSSWSVLRASQMGRATAR